MLTVAVIEVAWTVLALEGGGPVCISGHATVGLERKMDRNGLGE
jgi:hypothetical protein